MARYVLEVLGGEKKLWKEVTEAQVDQAATLLGFNKDENLGLHLDGVNSVVGTVANGDTDLDPRVCLRVVTEAEWENSQQGTLGV